MDEKNTQQPTQTENLSREITDTTHEMERRFADMAIRAVKAENANPNANPNKPSRNSLPIFPPFTITAALSLIYIGVILLWSAFITGDVVVAFRLSPVILVFIGLEILYNKFIKKQNVKFNAHDCFLAAFLILFTFMLSVVSVSLEDSGAARILAQERLAGDLKAKIAKDISKTDFESLNSADIDITLNGKSANSYGSLHSIKPSDAVNVRFYFSPVQGSLHEFAADCRFMLDILSHYHLPFEEIEFFSVDKFNRLHAKVDLSFGDHMSEADIAAAANFYIADTDFDFDLIYSE